MRALYVLALLAAPAGWTTVQPPPAAPATLARAVSQVTRFADPQADPLTPSRVAPEVETTGPPDVSRDFPEALRPATLYVGGFVRTFAAVIWRERYLQEVRARLRFNTSGNTFSTVTERRQLESELFFLWLPRDASWIAVRDVIAIDGTPRSAGGRPLRTLLDGRSVSVDQLRLLASENARFNIGPVLRTFTEPTLALLFLDEHYRHRFAFTAEGEQTIDGRRATRYRFAEHARPTVIQNARRDVPARGTLTVESSTGRVLQTALELSDPTNGLEGRMTVRFRAVPEFDVLVPIEMRETYAAPGGQEITALATYSDFRRFETSGRIIVPQ